jgi:hypothetical protein
MRSRNKTRLVGLAALAVAMAAMGAEAYAQSSGAIEVGSLAELDPWGVGATPRGEAPLPRNIWVNSDAIAVAGLFDKLPQTFGSPTAVRMARRVLLAPGGAPSGDSIIAARKRFEGMARMGLADQLPTMASASREARADAAIAIAAAQAELARGRTSEACRRVDGIQTTETPAFALRLKALCQAISGETEAAQLAIEIAKAAGAGDAWLESVIGLMNGVTPARPVAGRYDTSLNTLASLTAKLRPPARDALTGASAFSLMMLAQSGEAPIELRANAAAAALRQNLINADVARQALRDAVAQPRPGGLLKAQIEMDAASGVYAQALALEGVLRRANSQTEFLASARLFERELVGLPQDSGTAPAALTLARAALSLGDVNRASAWRRVADAATSDPAIVAILDLANAMSRNDADGVRIAAQRRIDTARPQAQGLVARDIMAVMAAGFELDQSSVAMIARAVPAPGRRIDPLLAAQLSSAAQRNALGETALVAALILGDGAERLDAATLTQVVRALQQVGLADMARAATVEALIAGQARATP